MSKRIHISKILKITPLDILYGMRGKFDIIFDDDKILNMDAHELCVSRYFWEFPKKHNMKINSDLKLSNFYESGFFTSSTHKEYFSYVYKKYIKEYLEPQGILTFQNMEDSWKTMFDVVNSLYSELQYHILEYGVSLSILDYIDLQKDPELLQAIADAKADRLNPQHVDKINTIIKRVMNNNPDNNLSKLYNCGAANRTQISHGIGVRGFVTDINNMIYSELVGTNLTMGLDGFYDLAAESAVMAKALKLQEFGVRYSEWLQRELHLVSMNIRTIELGDCGNDYYHEWLVKDKNELSLLDGTNALIDGIETEIDPLLHQHLIGNIIKIRRVLDCKHLKHGTLCSKCLGALSYTIPGHASPAHTFLTVLMAAVAQLMLSAKHYTESTVLKVLKLSAVALRYLKLNESDYYVRNDLNKDKTYHVVLDSESYYGFRLLSSSMTDKIDTLDTNKLSKVDKIYIKVTDAKGDSIREFVEIKQDGRSGILDQDFIIHSISNTSINTTGEYEIDMTNYNGRLLFLENKEFAFDQFNAEFKALLLSVGKKKKISPDKMVMDVFNYLIKKLPINIKIVEILVAAITIEDRAKGDFSTGLNTSTREVSSYSDVIKSRSVGISLGFAEQKNIINSAINYLGRPQPYNPLENVWNVKNIIWSTVKVA